ISWHILADHGWDESDRGKYDDDLGKAIAEGTITISQLEKAAQSGDIDQIKDLIITLIEVELPSGYTGAQIKVALIEKYGEGNSGKLDEDELEPVGDAWPGHKLYADAAVALQMMAAAYKEEFGREIELTDSYRSYKEQVATKKEKGKYAAQPGHSNHGCGLAVDLGGGINDFGTRQHEWMRKHAEQFGFVLPNWAHDGKGIEEPWHWEYVGKPIDGNRDEDKRDDKEKEGKDQEKDKDKERNASPIEVYKDERLTKHLSSHYQTAEANRPPFNEAKHYSWNGQKGPMVPMRDIVILLASQGFRGEALVIATAISVPEAVGEYRDGEMWVPLYITGDKHLGDNSISTCFMQIHNSYESKAGDRSLLDPERLLDPLYCARLAKYKFDNGGFKHWTTYNEGKHLPYLDDAREAMEAVEAASGVDLGS